MYSTALFGAILGGDQDCIQLLREYGSQLFYVKRSSDRQSNNIRIAQADVQLNLMKFPGRKAPIHTLRNPLSSEHETLPFLE